MKKYTSVFWLLLLSQLISCASYYQEPPLPTSAWIESKKNDDLLGSNRVSFFNINGYPINNLWFGHLGDPIRIPPGKNKIVVEGSPLNTPRAFAVIEFVAELNKRYQLDYIDKRDYVTFTLIDLESKKIIKEQSSKLIYGNETQVIYSERHVVKE